MYKQGKDLRKEIKEALMGDDAEKNITLYYTYMNFHLGLLHKAITDGNEEQRRFQTQKLIKIREILLGLEYFSLS